MGLIKAAIGAVGGTLHEQWEDLIKCDNMDNNTLMVKQTTATGQISKGSRIIVAPGQVAVIYDSGNILDATAEEGNYSFDESTSPSFFAGQFGAVFKEMWERFKYDGTPAKEQAVYFFNAKEIINNKFGTGAPVPFQDWSHAIPNQMTGSINPMSLNIRCYGTYTFKICDPALFMRQYAGSANIVTKDELLEQMRSEVIHALQNILNEMGNSVHKVPVDELPSYTDEIKKTLDEKVFDQPIRDRGMKLVSFAIESVTKDEESQRKINEYEHNSNSMMQQGRVLDVMEKAASNEGGSANAFMGLGVMNMASGGMTGGVMQNAFSNPGPQATFDPYNKPAAPVTEEVKTEIKQPEAVKCTNCGTIITGKFCTECGTPAPVKETGPKKCSNCGAEVTGKFCTECGTKAE